MQQSIRSHVDQTAGSLQLGPPTAIYQQVLSPATKRRKYWAMLLSSVFIMFFPAFTLIGSLLSIPRQPLLIMIGTVFFITFGILTLLLVLVLVRHMTRPWYVFLYAEGFISAKGRKIEAVRWDQVRQLRFLQFTDMLSLADGRKFTFDNSFLNLETAHAFDPHSRDVPWFKWTFFKWNGPDEAEVSLVFDRWEEVLNQETELIHRMEREILTRLVPRILATYQEGLPVSFGRLQISRKGIRTGKMMLPWDEVDQMSFRRYDDDHVPDIVSLAAAQTLTERLAWWQREVSLVDTMLIRRKGKHDAFWSKNVSDVPNAFLLMELVSYALRQLP